MIMLSVWTTLATNAVVLVVIVLVVVKVISSFA